MLLNDHKVGNTQKILIYLHLLKPYLEFPFLRHLVGVNDLSRALRLWRFMDDLVQRTNSGFLQLKTVQR